MSLVHTQAESRANFNIISSCWVFSCQILKMSKDGERRSHDVSGQPVLVLNHCHGEEHFPYGQLEFLSLQTVITIHCPLYISEKRQGMSSLQPSSLYPSLGS